MKGDPYSHERFLSNIERIDLDRARKLQSLARVVILLIALSIAIPILGILVTALVTL